MNEKYVPVWRRVLPFAVLLAALWPAVVLFTGVLGRKADAEALTWQADPPPQRGGCYALEGFYPADVDYLYGEYGVSVDRGATSSIMSTWPPT